MSMFLAWIFHEMGLIQLRDTRPEAVILYFEGAVTLQLLYNDFF